VGEKVVPAVEASYCAEDKAMTVANVDEPATPSADAFRARLSSLEQGLRDLQKSMAAPSVDPVVELRRIEGMINEGVRVHRTKKELTA
jgi:hypothetical protein